MKIRTTDRRAGKLCVLFAGGGTGGHLYPAIAIAEEIRNRAPNCEIHFVGTRHGLEAKVLPPMGYHVHWNSIRGLRRKFAVENLLLPIRIVVSAYQCLHLLHKVGPHVVIGTGGYVSGPTLFFAAILGIPTLIQEQNSYPGVTTRFLSVFVGQVHLSFEESRKYFRNQQKILVSGNPVRSFSKVLEKETARKQLGLEAGRKTLLVFGGSQGAHAINMNMAQAVKSILSQTDCQILWGTGAFDYDEICKAGKSFGGRVMVREYIDNMGLAYNASDLVICRAGATTLAEITLMALPSILIPYPYAAAGHQLLNAKALEKCGAAKVIIEEELSSNALQSQVVEILSNDQKLKEMSGAAFSASKPQAAKDITDAVMKLAGRN